MDTFIQSSVTTSTTRKKVNVPNEKQISSDTLAETIKGFNRSRLQLTIDYSAYYHSEKMTSKAIQKAKNW